MPELLDFPNRATWMAFKLSRDSHYNISLLAVDGNLYELHDIVCSGSGYTMLFDSNINLMRKRYLQIRITGKPQKLTVLGDDSAEGGGHEWTYAQIKSIIDKHFACTQKGMTSLCCQISLNS